MPYNPSSAYPRHTTYTPPVFGRGFARGFNEQEWGERIGAGRSLPPADVGHALQAASRQPDHQMTAAALTAQNRVGLFSMGTAAIDRRAQEERDVRRTRKIWNRAEYGDDPNEIAGPSQVGRVPVGDLNWPGNASGPREIDTRTPEGRAEAQKLFGVTPSPGRGNVRGGRDPLLDSGPVVPGQVLGGRDPLSDTGGRPHVAPVNERLGAIVDRITTSSAMNQAVNQVLSGKVGGPMTVPKLVFGAARYANRKRRGSGTPPPTRDLPF